MGRHRKHGISAGISAGTESDYEGRNNFSGSYLVEEPLQVDTDPLCIPAQEGDASNSKGIRMQTTPRSPLTMKQGHQIWLLKKLLRDQQQQTHRMKLELDRLNNSTFGSPTTMMPGAGDLIENSDLNQNCDRDRSQETADSVCSSAAVGHGPSFRAINISNSTSAKSPLLTRNVNRDVKPSKERQDCPLCFRIGKYCLANHAWKDCPRRR